MSRKKRIEVVETMAPYQMLCPLMSGPMPGPPQFYENGERKEIQEVHCVGEDCMLYMPGNTDYHGYCNLSVV